MADVEAQVPPHDLDSEAAVISACMNDRDKVDIVADILRPEHFYSEAHRQIYDAILAVHERGDAPDLVTVASCLRDRDRLAQVGGMAYMTTVNNSAPGLANTRAYAETVFGHWRVRQLLIVMQRSVSQGYGGLASFGGPSGYIEGIAEDVFQLAIIDRKMEVGSVKDTMREVFDAIAKATAAGRDITGLATGFERYDHLTTGLHDGELTIMAARPGMGKTALALNMATFIAGKAVDDEPGFTTGVLVFSLEMPREQLVQRMLGAEAKVDAGKLRRPQTLNITDWQKLTAAAGILASKTIRVDAQSGINLTQLRAKTRRTIAEERRRKVKIVLVVVDYLQLMTGRGDEGNREQEISGISRGLKGLAKDLGLPVIALAQLNRAVEARTKDKRPQLSDLRESGAIEQDADNVVFIYRDDYYDKESAERNVAELILAKQRNGPTDTVKLRWDGMYTRFDNLADGESEEYER